MLCVLINKGIQELEVCVFDRPLIYKYYWFTLPGVTFYLVHFCGFCYHAAPTYCFLIVRHLCFMSADETN